MNILLTSVGRRSYLVDYFKEALQGNGKIHVANSNSVTPAFQRADQYVVTPLIYDKKYISFLKNYCQDNNIDAIISLFDVDLPVLAKNKSEFKSIGVRVIVSDEDVIELCNDKWKSYCFLYENGINVPRTYLTLDEVRRAIDQGTIRYPVMVKPRFGMGSIGIMQADNETEASVFYRKVLKTIQKSYLKYESQTAYDQCVLFQEMLEGEEYGLDVINDLKGKYQNTVVKRKYAMRSGETDCAVTVKSKRLEKLGLSLSKLLNHVGNLDVDIMMVRGVPYILEMNARFGGGYPFSHIAGVNLPKAIVDWLMERETDPENFIYQEGVWGHKDITLVRIDP